METRFKGWSVVVTGASSGVGRATARAFAAAGADVALIARNEEGLSAAAAEVRSNGVRALPLPLDVADSDAVERAAREVVATFGKIDVWVNNAMVSVFAPAARMTFDEYRRVTEVNYLGYVHGTLCALRHMRTRDAGVVVQVGSALAYRSIPLQSAYCATKAAIRSFTDSLRSELLHDKSKVRLTAVHLPALNTPQFEVVRNKLPRHPQPVPPIFQPEVAARAILHAAAHPRREFWVGWPTIKAILGQMFVPGFVDRYLAKTAYSGQQTAELAHRHGDNLDAPGPGDRGAHGEFDDLAKPRSIASSLRIHTGHVAATAFVLGAAGVLFSLRRAPAWR